MELKKFSGVVSQAAIVEHSLNTHTGKEITTYWLRYPLYLHPEFMTHRVFSRNASSSRAIPSKKLIGQVRTGPAFFSHVGKNQPGMQAHAQVSRDIQRKFKREWKELANITAGYVERWTEQYGIHKQTANRALMPYLFVEVVVTATEWDNFFELRDHADAQPEIRDLAQTMLLAKRASTPRHVVERSFKDPRDWHLPFVTMEERQAYIVRDLIAMSAARCARTSYLTHDKANPTLTADIGLYKRLIESRPMHASPIEHQAAVSSEDVACANFKGGWLQHRVMMEHAGSLENLQHILTDSE